MTLRGRSLLLAGTLAISLVAGCTAPPKQAAPRPAETAALEPLRVGAWNIEWLGTPQRRSGPARNHLQTPEALAEYILAADVDLLGLEEIKIDAADGSDTNSVLTAALEIVEEERGGRWRQRLFRTSYGRDQCCGIAWDETRVTLTAERLAIRGPAKTSTQGKMLWSRPPRALLFSAGAGLTDFVVIVIHMKADYRGDYAQHRAEEARRLVRDVPQAFSDPDVVILGDANCESHAEPAVARIVAAGFVDLNRHDANTHWRYGALDRVFVPADQPEFARQCFEVLSDGFIVDHDLTATEFKTNYSDHFMVITEIDVLADDD
jgi:hypothetical protein